MGNPNTTISDLMRPAVLVDTSTTLFEALSKMIQERRNSLVVVSQDGTVAGAVNAVDIIMEVLPDYLEEDRVAAHFADTSLLKEDALRVKERSVESFMAKRVATVTPESSLIEAAVLATKQGRGRIIVVDEKNKPLGVLTRTEIKHVIAGFLDIPGIET